MKAVRFIGGLGNQMFQYAFMRGLQERMKGEQVYADVSYYKSMKQHNGLELETLFDLTLPKAGWRELIRVTLPVPWFKLMRARLRLGLKRGSEIVERDDHSYIDQKIYRQGKNLYYHGYWQDEHYFAHVREELLREFRFRPFTDERNKELEKYLKRHDCCSLHVRRGDYINSPKYEGCCDETYYQEAIEYSERIFKPEKYLVFSNDIEWCRRNLPAIEGKAEFVDWNTGKESYNDMALMSLCRWNIIANSTFSWWGAWLNRHPGKGVIAPKKWTNSYWKNTPNCKDWVTF